MTAAPSRPVPCRTCCPVAVRSPTPPRGSTWPPPGASSTCPRRPAVTATPSWRAAAAGELGGLVVGGVDPADLPDPALARQAVEQAGFVVALEVRALRGDPRRRRRLPGRAGHRPVRHVRELGGPGPPVRQGPAQPRPRCPTCGCSPASPRSWAPASASAPPSRSGTRWSRSVRGTASGRPSTRGGSTTVADARSSTTGADGAGPRLLEAADRRRPDAGRRRRHAGRPRASRSSWSVRPRSRPSARPSATRSR